MKVEPIPSAETRSTRPRGPRDGGDDGKPQARPAAVVAGLGEALEDPRPVLRRDPRPLSVTQRRSAPSASSLPISTREPASENFTALAASCSHAA